MNTRKLKPIYELNRLSEAERAQLWTDLENGLSYSRAIRVLGTEHFVTIRRHRLFTWWHRENDRRAMNARLPAENQVNAVQFFDLLNAQSLPWSDLMHGRILQAGFLLANREDHTPAQLLTLQRIANNPFNQHLASEKLDLSKRGLALREKQIAARSATQKNSSLSASPREDHLGPLARNMEGVEARAKAKFGSLNEANGLQSESPGISESLPLAPAIHPGDASSGISGPLSLSPGLQSGGVNAAAVSPSLTSLPSVESALVPSAALFEISAVKSFSPSVPSVVKESPSSPSSVVKKNADPCPSETSAVKNESSPPPPSSLNSVPLVVNQPSLEDRVNQYTLERFHEALHGKDTLKVGKWNAWKFKSKMQWCPCGQHLPCSDHGEFPPHFWELMPTCGDYIEILQRKNLPYTHPQIFMQQQDRRDRKLAAEKELLLQWPDENARSSMLNERAKSHALRRWYSHTPRPRGSPPPDESWTEECPCGGQLPCDLHDDLWRRVRYLKPWDPEYVAALKSHGIPIHTPVEDKPLPLPQPSSKSSDSPEYEPVNRAKIVQKILRKLS